MLGPFATATPVLHCHSPGVATVEHRLRIDGRNNIDNNQQQRVTEGTAMAPWNRPNNIVKFSFTRVSLYCCYRCRSISFDDMMVTGDVRLRLLIDRTISFL